MKRDEQHAPAEIPSDDKESRRRFIRHPAEIPIKVWQVIDTDSPNTEYLHNIGLGGLAFESAIEWQVDTLIGIRITLDTLTFEYFGKVVWCRKREDHFYVGVKVAGDQETFTEDMVEEVCQVEIYRNILLSIADEISTSFPDIW
jgi:hypothetical protein